MARDVTLTIKVKDGEVVKAEQSLHRLDKAARNAGMGGTVMATAIGSAVGGLVSNVLANLPRYFVEAGRAALGMAKDFADFAKQIDNASQRTGLSVEILSSLKAVVEGAGGSFDMVQQGLVAFQKKISDAADGSKKAIAELTRLGIEPVAAIKNFEGAFRTALTSIAQLPAGVDKTTAAIAAFGQEIGPKLVPIINQYNGNVDEMVKRARELGLAIGGEQVKAAKDFDRAYDEVGQRLQGVKNLLGSEVLPVFRDFFEQLNGWLADNKGEVKSWAESVGTFFRSLVVQIKKEMNDVEAMGDFLHTMFVEGFWSAAPDKWEKYAQRQQQRTAKELQFQILQKQGYRERNWMPSNSMDYDDYAASLSRQLPSGVPLDRSGTTATPRKTRSGGNGEAEMRRFFEEMGFNVTRTFGSELNKGSLHPLGRAADISIRGKTTEQITNLIAAAIEHGYRLFDERIKRKGVFQTGPHLHFERNQNKASDFLGQDFYSAPVAYLRSLDQRRLGKGTITPGDIGQFLSQQSDELTKGARDANTRQIVEIYKRSGMVPTPELIKRIHSLMVEEAKKAGSMQPTADDVREMFLRNPTLSTTDAALPATIGRRPSLDEDYVKNFRDSLGLEERMTELIFRRRNQQEVINSLVEDYVQSLEQAKTAAEIEYQVLLKRNLATEAAIERERERNGLVREIGDLQIAIANAGANDTLILQAAHLRDILDLRNRELDAVIRIQRAQLELSQSMKVSGAQIKADVMDHLARQRTLNQSIADGITGTYDAIAKRLDENIDKMFEWAGVFQSLFAEPLKAFARNSLTKVTKGLLDAFIPGLGTEMTKTNNPIARPIVDELETTNKLLSQLVKATGQVPASGGFGGLGSLFSGLFGGGGGAGGTGGFFGGSGPSHEGIHNLGGGSAWSNLKDLFSTKEGGIFARRQTVWGGSSRMGGIMGGIGDLATVAGGIIGGRAGNILSMAGTGASIGAMFGPWGAAIGAGIGALIGIFGGDPKRKRDKNEKIPQLNKGFTDALAQLNEILTGVRNLSIDPDEAIRRANEVRGQIAGGFGVQFESKKYRKQSQTMIAGKLREADVIIDQIKAAAEIARGAADRSKRILPEFAGGGFLNFPNGMLPGIFDGRDSIYARLSRGELVLNPRQQSNVRSLAGFDVFAGAGIPNYPNASTSSKLAVGGIAGAGMPTGMVTVNPTFTLLIQGVAVQDEVKATLLSDDGRRQLVKVLIDEKKKDARL